MRYIQFLKRTASPVALSAVLSVTTIGAPIGAAAQELEGEIRFSWWGGQLRNEKTNRILNLFEEENPGVTVVREQSDWNPHWDRLTIQSSAGNQPCTIQMQTRWLATYAEPDILMPLDDLVESGAIDISGIPESVMDSSRGDDGNLYMIPSGVFFFALMFNRTMAEESGVPIPEDGYSWSDFHQWIAEVKPTLPEGVNGTHNMGREIDAFVTWVQSQGEEMFENGEVAFSAEVTVEWFEYWEQMREEGLTDSPETMVSDEGSLIEESNIANARTFVTNRPPNRLASHQQVLDAVAEGQKLGIQPYPRGEDGTGGMDLGANGIAIGATCPEEMIDESVAWINFFTQDPEAAAIYESDNGVVAIDRFQTAQAESPDTSEAQREQILMFQELAPSAKPVSWPEGGYNALQDALQRAYDAVAFEIMSPEDAAQQLLTDLESVL